MLQEFINRLKNGVDVEFSEVMDVISENYEYTPIKFSNGIGDDVVVNEQATNEGSCKIFTFAKLNDLSKNETLACFGKYYRVDVLENPGGSDHANIRTFIKHGWDGIKFDSCALEVRN